MARRRYRYKAMPYALLSLQFWRKSGTPMFTVTSNLTKKRKLDDSMFTFSFEKFGRDLAKLDDLDEEDKRQLDAFCEAYLKERGKI